MGKKRQKETKFEANLKQVKLHHGMISMFIDACEKEIDFLYFRARLNHLLNTKGLLGHLESLSKAHFRFEDHVSRMVAEDIKTETRYREELAKATERVHVMKNRISGDISVIFGKSFAH